MDLEASVAAVRRLGELERRDSPHGTSIFDSQLDMLGWFVRLSGAFSCICSYRPSRQSQSLLGFVVLSAGVHDTQVEEKASGIRGQVRVLDGKRGMLRASRSHSCMVRTARASGATHQKQRRCE